MSAHEQAVILNVDNRLGKNPYDLVSIDEIENCYATTQAAKVNSFVCANSSCGVSVTAVITQKKRLNRKRSPSSYFAAKPNSHIVGCDRQPKPKELHQSESGSIAPKEEKSKYRTKWIDPRSQSGSSGSQEPIDAPASSEGDSGSGRGKVSGVTSNKPSQGQSSLVKRFAEDWLSMTVRERRSTPLDAPWNVGGSYFSALVPLVFYKKREIDGLGERIYSGILKDVVQGRTGITLVLQEPHLTGFPFWVWVTNQALNERASGTSLHTKLNKLIKTNSRQEYRVFALGEFMKQTRGERSWWSLQVNHPAMIAILVDDYPI